MQLPIGALLKYVKQIVVKKSETAYNHGPTFSNKVKVLARVVDFGSDVGSWEVTNLAEMWDCDIEKKHSIKRIRNISAERQ